MSHSVQLTVFFAISVALHGAGLWAAAGRLEPRAPEPSAEVAIVDRDLFFRHAERIETQAAQPVSVSDRLAPVSGDTVQPRQPDDSVAPAPAVAARESEPERHSPESPADSVARIDLSTLEPMRSPRRDAVMLEHTGIDRTEPERHRPEAAADAVARLHLPTLEPMRPPRREAVALENSGVERTERIRLSGIAATAPPAGSRLRVQPPVTAEPASRARSMEPEYPGRQRIRQAQSVLLASARAADSVLRTAAEPVVRGTIDVMDSVQPDPPPVRDLERSLAESAQRMAAVDSTPIEPSSPSAPADESEPRRIAAQDARPALRGTLRPPAITPREPEIAQPLDAPVQARAVADAVRLRGTRAEEVVVGSLRLGAVPAEAAPPATRVAVRALQATLSRNLSAPGPATAAEATPHRLAAREPAAAGARVKASDRTTLLGSDPADRFTRAYQGGECFFPVRVASRDGGEIRGYGLQADSVEMFRQAFAQALGTDPEIDWRPLTDAQCGGISFARVILGDAAPSIEIGLASKRLELGEALAGRVTGTEFEFVTLLIIDDSGVVHNVLDYLHPETAELEFSIPVYPVDDGEDRVQLIMAVATSKRLALLESTTPVHSDDFFPSLLAQAREIGATLELGLQDFVILEGP